MAVLTSDKVNFRAKKVIRNKYNNKRIIQENIMVLNVYVLIDRVSNTWSTINRAEKRNRQIYSCSWGFRTPAIPSNQKISRSEQYNQQNPSDIYRKIHLKTVKYTFFKYSCYIKDIPYILENILKELKPNRICSMTLMELN